jgi:hypothetical protein
LKRKLAGDIHQRLETPARFTNYKLGLNYIFLIEHSQGRILVVPSAKVPLGLGDTKADVVFLSIADTDKLSNEHIRRTGKRPSGIPIRSSSCPFIGTTFPGRGIRCLARSRHA